MSKTFKRGIQIAIVAALVSINFQLAARTANDEQQSPEWYCVNIFCPINQDICSMSGGSMSCYWSSATDTCDFTPCLY